MTAAARLHMRRRLRRVYAHHAAPRFFRPAGEAIRMHRQCVRIDVARRRRPIVVWRAAR